MNTASPMYEWKDIPWKQVEKDVFKLQKRIYQASHRGDVKAVRKLQKLLLGSWSARCLAVRRVTQDNRGKKTAGVDGVKNLLPSQRLKLVRELSLSQKPKPVRRVWIPKPGKEEKRPLGIPVMKDRALQALAKLALEPEWEARFEPNSYGFRPGRSCHDAIQAIYLSINKKDKYVLDADIRACFDKICQSQLLAKLNTFPTLERLIKGWLKAGVMDGDKLFPSEEGTPQGGVASPLLANIALHGLETAIRNAFPPKKFNKRWQPTVVRYADDFVVIHSELKELEKAKRIAEVWLAGIGLELKPSKTRITHTLRPHEGNVGFDFLGFHIRQYPSGKTHCARVGGPGARGQLLGFKTLIKPSKEAQKRHLLKIKEIIKRKQDSSQAGLIYELNPVIRGWANYYRSVVCAATFRKMDHILFLNLRSWARRRHNDKTTAWALRKYWRLETGWWNFATRQGYKLYRHRDTLIVRHIKVKESRSPYDGDWIYWATRMGRQPGIPSKVAYLLKQQGGKCSICELFFKDGDKLETDHIIPRSQGGTSHCSNLQLLHRHCHHRKSAKERCL